MHAYSTAQKTPPLLPVWRTFASWVVTASAENGSRFISVCVCVCRSVQESVCCFAVCWSCWPIPHTCWMLGCLVSSTALRLLLSHIHTFSFYSVEEVVVSSRTEKFGRKNKIILLFLTDSAIRVTIFRGMANFKFDFLGGKKKG